MEVHVFLKDTISLLNQALIHGESLNVLEGTIKTNNHQIRYFHDLILNYFIKNNLKRNITIRDYHLNLIQTM